MYIWLRTIWVLVKYNQKQLQKNVTYKYWKRSLTSYVLRILKHLQTYTQIQT